MKRISGGALCACATLLVCTAVLAQEPATTFKTLVDFTTKQDPGMVDVFVQARDGNLYTTSQSGGSGLEGTAFQLTPAGKIKILHNFDLPSGATPWGGLTLGTDGFLYGTTCRGGDFSDGVVFKMSTTGTYTVMHSFNTANNEGYCPKARPIQGTDGNFYGTTSLGPNPSHGTFYKITPSGTLTTLYLFNLSDGQTPLALVLGTDGNFYGESDTGGVNDSGAIFKLTSSGAFTPLHSFDNNQGRPRGPIIQASDGNLYGAGLREPDIYKTTTSGVLTPILTLNKQTTGIDTYAGVIQATDAKLYTVMTSGGTTGAGTILQLTTTGTPSVLHNFAITDGYAPESSMFQATSGVLYGSTPAGGTTAYGTIFSLNQGIASFVMLLPQLSSGKAGATIQILGQGLTGTTAVSFNGKAAAFKVVSAGCLTATVPAVATTGFVTVTVSGRNLKSN